MELRKKRIMIFGVLLISVILFSLAITYAFFSGNLGESSDEVVKKQVGTLALTFSDTDTFGNMERTLNFGDTVEKELKIENSGTQDAYAKISWDDLTNTFTDGSLTYTLEYKISETGTYQSTIIKNNKVPISSTTSKQLIVDHLEIPSGATYIYKVIITYNSLDVDQTQDLNATFRTKFTLDEGSESLVAKIAASAKDSSNIDFATPATTDETVDGLYSLEDDYGTSYYYRGAVENNYVKFGKNKAGQDMYWRIIRFNGDGSARLMYDGTQVYANGIADDSRYTLIDQRWDGHSYDAKSVGWMFGDSAGTTSTSKEEVQRNEIDSAIKKKADEWYVENIQETGYSKYLTDAVFCNDRSTPGPNTNGWTDDTGKGFGKSTTAYGIFERFLKGNGKNILWKTSEDNIQPTFKCKNINDAFTLKNDASLEVARTENEQVVGNKALAYPVGLITADEIVTAGSGLNKSNKNYYLYKSSNYSGWSFSPCAVYGTLANMSVISPGGSLSMYTVGNTGVAAAPVINLAAEYVNALKGEGTRIEPYTLSTQ